MLKAPLGSWVASVTARPRKEPPTQYTGNGARISPSSTLCGIGLVLHGVAARAERKRTDGGE